MLSACQLMVILWSKEFMTSFRCYLIFYYLILILSYLISRTFVCTDVMVLRLLFIYFQFWDEVQTLSQMYGRLYFPIFLFRVDCSLLLQVGPA